MAAQQERDAIKVQLQEAQEQVGDMKTAVAYMLVFLVMATAVFVALTRRAPALRIEPLPSERAKATKDLSLRV